jgi:hypothetical protein
MIALLATAPAAPRAKVAVRLLPAIVALLVVVVCAPLAVLGGGGGEGDAVSPAGLPQGARPFVEVYTDAARAFRVSPFLLMAVHEDETNYSTAALPGVADGLNFAGCCAGPMQFSITGGATPAVGGTGGTWAGYSSAFRRARVLRPANYPGRVGPHHPNVYDSVDSIYAAAAYFHALGAARPLDRRTLNALASYKGTPPASLPYARHDYERAEQLQRLAQTEAESANPLDDGLGAASGSGLALLQNRRVALSADAQADLHAHRISPRLIALLDHISQRHTIAVSVLSLGHAPGTNHQPGRAADIAVVDGEVCNALAHGRAGKCWALGQELDRIRGCLHPTELIYFYDPGPTAASFARADHADHVHAGWDGPLGKTMTYNSHLRPCSSSAIS